ncbi:hypothetical protein ACJW31_02G139200 [Castanea mollissima]
MAKSPEVEHPKKAFGWAARDASGILSPFKFSRRATGEKDVTFKILYCGICHSDLHMLKNEWGISTYPLVLGHEIVGMVTEVGSKVHRFRVGDKVGVGCLVGAYRSCNDCSYNLENYCPKSILTYGAVYHDGTTTYGGYFDIMVANEHFVIRILDNLPLDAGHVAVKFAKAMAVKITVISTSPNKKMEALEHLGADSFLVSTDQGQIQAALGTLDGIC